MENDFDGEKTTNTQTRVKKKYNVKCSGWINK